MTTVSATGQFGPKLFSVLSRKGAVVGAKWLTDNTGASYIIDPSTGRPYIVPRDYDPSATAVYFSNRLKDAMASPTLDDGGASRVQTSIYQELRNAFRQGGWGDLQRLLADKTDFVPAFTAAASFNLGIAAAAGGVSASEAVIFGGLYNVIQNGFGKLIDNPLQFGNSPEHPPHIRDGADQFNQGILGVKYSENSTTSPNGQQTATNIDFNKNGRTDSILTTTRGTDNSNVENVRYLTPTSLPDDWSDTLSPFMRELRKYKGSAPPDGQASSSLNRAPSTTPAFQLDAVYSPDSNVIGNFPRASAGVATLSPAASGSGPDSQITDELSTAGKRDVPVLSRVGQYIGNSLMAPAAAASSSWPPLPGPTTPNLPSEQISFGDGPANAPGGPRPDTYQQLRRVSSAFPGAAPPGPGQPAPSPERAPPLGKFSSKPMSSWLLPPSVFSLPDKSGASGNDLFNFLAGIASWNQKIFCHSELPESFTLVVGCSAYGKLGQQFFGFWRARCYHRSPS
jgi:hypothetical protein